MKNLTITTGRPSGRRLLLAALLAWLACWGVAAAQPARSLHLERTVVTPADPAVTSLVHRFVPLEPGDRVDGRLLAELRGDLERAGFFREVVFYTERGARPGGIVLRIEVALDRKVRFLTGFGHEPFDGWYLNLLGARVLNQPRPGSELRLAFRQGWHVGGLYLSGRFAAGDHPDDAMLLDLHAQERQSYAYDRREGWVQRIESSALLLGRQWPLGDGLRLTGWLGVRTVDPDDQLSIFYDDGEQTRPASDLVAAGTGRASFVQARLEVARDALDKVRPWLAGHWLGTRLELGQQFDGPHFATLEVDGLANLPVGRHHGLAGRVHLAHATDATPYFDRFQFGGYPTVRGYDVAFLSGPLGATDVVLASLEYRHGILDTASPTPRLTGVLLLDTGQAWDRSGGSAGWVAGAGLGLRVRLPWVQLIGVDVGYPLVDVGDMSPFSVNLALGWSY